MRVLRNSGDLLFGPAPASVPVLKTEKSKPQSAFFAVRPNESKAEAAY